MRQQRRGRSPNPARTSCSPSSSPKSPASAFVVHRSPNSSSSTIQIRSTGGGKRSVLSTRTLVQRQVESTLGLQLAEVQAVLRRTITKYSPTEGAELRTMAESHSYQLDILASQESVDSPMLWNAEVLEGIANVLNTFLAVAPRTTPPSKLALVHTILGQIREREGEPEAAVQSFQMALWIKNSASSTSTDHQDIGMALHRLAVAYGRAGSKNQARWLLEQAISKYETSKKPNSLTQPFIIAARDRLESYRTSCSHFLDSTPTIPSSTAVRSNRSGSRGARDTAGGDILSKQGWRSLPAPPLWNSSSNIGADGSADDVESSFL